MKIAFGIILTTLCLTYSAVAAANQNNLVEKCARQLSYKPTHTFLEDKAPEGYRIESFVVTGDSTKFRLVKSCISSEFSRKFPIDKTKMADVEYHKVRNKQRTEEFKSSYEFLDNTHSVLDNKNKIKFNFNYAKGQTLEEMCESQKGKPNHAYEYCMGTRTAEKATCKNSLGDACGTKYDQNSIGYTIKD